MDGFLLPLEDAEAATRLLARFGAWGVFSAACHVTAFGLIAWSLTTT